MRIVLDTASFITALRSRGGAAAEVVRLILLGSFVVLMDMKLSLEYRDVALRPEHLMASGLSEADVLAVIEAVEAMAEAVMVVHRPRPLSIDPNDDMVLDVAINGGADVVVTGNRKHFAAAGKQFDFAVMSPAELLGSLREETLWPEK